MTGGTGHPLPESEEARHREVPEHAEAETGRGDDGKAITNPNPTGVNPEGEAYEYADLGNGPDTGPGSE